MLPFLPGLSPLFPSIRSKTASGNHPFSGLPCPSPARTYTHTRVFIWIRHLDDDGAAAARGAFFHFSTDFCMAQVMRARDHPFPSRPPYPHKPFRGNCPPWIIGGSRFEARKRIHRGGNRCFPRWRTKLPPTVHTSKQDNPYLSLRILPLFGSRQTYSMIHIREKFQTALPSFPRHVFFITYAKRRTYGNDIATRHFIPTHFGCVARSGTQNKGPQQPSIVALITVTYTPF